MASVSEPRGNHLWQRRAFKGAGWPRTALVVGCLVRARPSAAIIFDDATGLDDIGVMVEGRATGTHHARHGHGDRPLSNTSSVLIRQSVLEAYSAQHGPDALAFEFAAEPSSVCRRRYVQATYACPVQFGNRMGEFFNSIAFAVITNRTVIVRESEARGDCLGYLAWQGRLALEVDVREMQTKAGCLMDRAPIEWAFGFEGKRKGSRQESKLFECCAFDKTGPPDVPFFYTGRLEREEVAMSAGNPRLGDEGKRRALALFGDGPFAGYGDIFNFVFRFRDIVRSPVDELLRLADGATKISVHSRHYPSAKMSADELDADTMACVRKVIKDYPGKPCAVLLATDREDTIANIQSEAQSLARKRSRRFKRSTTGVGTRSTWGAFEMETGCKVLTTPKQVQKGLKPEHGNWSGLTAMQDVYMLSQGDSFIGTKSSSFSERAAELFVTGRPEKAYHVRSTGCEVWMGLPVPKKDKSLHTRKSQCHDVLCDCVKFDKAYIARRC